MAYDEFAYVYDYLMRDVPYKDWLDFLQTKINKYEIRGKKVLELACGTGQLSMLLAKSGFDITGIDLSDDMLTVANQKAIKNNVKISLFQQNMSELEGLGEHDIVTIFCDSLNYLVNPEDIQETFKRVYAHLKKGGLFIFDVHSIYKIEKIFLNQTFADSDEDVSFIWNCFEGKYPSSVEHDLSFFVLDEQSSTYNRFDELHVQRTFSENDYRKWIEAAGFKILDVEADFRQMKPVDTSERIFYTCQK